MVFIPLKAVTVADPPKINMLDTMIFVAKPKKRKIRCAVRPQLQIYLSNKVSTGT
jgi:hypothetical protein